MTPELDTLAAPDSVPSVRIEVEELPRWRRRLTLVVPAERVSAERGRLTQRLAKRLKIPGFRPGKVPTQLVRQRLGAEVEHELVQELLRDAVREALESRGLEPVATPVVTSAELDGEGALRAVAELDVRPDVRLSRLGGFRIEPTEARVPEDAVDRVLERLREERAEVRIVDRPAARDDVVVADVEPLEGEGQPVRGYEVRLGSGEAGPEIETRLEGIRAGEAREVDTGGRRWRIEAREVRERTLPPLDDAFAATVSSAGSLAELREKLADNLRLEAEGRARAQQRERLVDAVAEANSVEVPESLVERWVERMLQPSGAGHAEDARGRAGGHAHAHAHGHRHGHNAPDAGDRGDAGDGPAEIETPQAADGDAEITRILREAAERSLRRMLVVEAVAREHRLEPTDEELDRFLAERATGGSTAEARRSLERSGRLEELRGHLRAENVYRFLEAQSGLRPHDEESTADATRRKE